MAVCTLLFTFSLALVACGPRITAANIEVVNKQRELAEAQGRSLTTKEVESILGQPTRIEPFTMEKPTIRELRGQRYIYEQDGRQIELHFVDNKLERRVTHFGAAEPDRGELVMKVTPTPAPAK